MIKPTVGRKVWFWPNGFNPSDQPYDATICYVWSDRCINIAYHDHNGHPAAAQSITLVQEGDTAQLSAMHCQWMPYQVEKAKEKEAQVSPARSAADILRASWI